MIVTSGRMDYLVAQIGLEYRICCRPCGARPKGAWYPVDGIKPADTREAAYAQLEEHIKKDRQSGQENSHRHHTTERG